MGDTALSRFAVSFLGVLWQAIATLLLLYLPKLHHVYCSREGEQPR